MRWDLPEINTWRLCNKAVTQAGVTAMVDQWEAAGYRCGAVCIDDGWQHGGRMGDWMPDGERVPDLRGLVAQLHGRGYGVRLWLAPCQVHPETAAWREAQGALLTRADGTPAFYRGLGTYTVDIRTAWGREHVRRVVREAAERWQVDAFKIDFPPFYTPDDEFYVSRGFALPEGDKQRMVGDFYALVREAADEVRPGLRLEAYPNCHGAAPYLDDVISGDLVGGERTYEKLVALAQKLARFMGDREMVGWYEMAWGEGGDAPHAGEAWHAGYLEFLAASINFGLKMEHSFQPFAYPNAEQIRCLTNLYGPRDRLVKVLVAGRRSFPVASLQASGVVVGPQTRFLVAPATTQTVTLHTAPLHTDALGWRCRQVVTGQPVVLRARNEFWSGTDRECWVQFEAQAGQTYVLWYEGERTTYFSGMLARYGTAAPHPAQQKVT